MDSLYVLSAGLELFFAVVAIVLFIGCLFGNDKKRPVNRVLTAMLAIHALMNIADACVWIWCDLPEHIALVKLLIYATYALGYTNLALLAYMLVLSIRERARVRPGVTRLIIAWSALAFGALIISMFTDAYYYWDIFGICHPGEYHIVGELFVVFILASNIALALIYRKALGARNSCIYVLYNSIMLLSYAFVGLWEAVPIHMASTIAMLLYYVIIHAERERLAAEQRERLARQEIALTNSRAAMLLSKIRPHFIYNTLTAIAQLCEKDPGLAKQTTYHFSAYLRRNMRSLDQKEPIPFEAELEHVRSYISIEQVRFGGKLRVEYDITATDFQIPALCLQTLVENAVMHGVSVSERGGTVSIRAFEADDHFEISVTDDGVGFDIDSIPADANEHIGIANARERLEIMMGAELLLESRKGRGTRAVIRIYKE